VQSKSPKEQPKNNASLKIKNKLEQRSRPRRGSSLIKVKLNITQEDEICQGISSPADWDGGSERPVKPLPDSSPQVNSHQDGIRVSPLREESRVRTAKLSKVIHFVLDGLVGLLEME
jgi:hypothetical protein